MKVPLTALFALLALASAQEVRRGDNQNAVLQKHEVVAKLENLLEEKRQMMRDHESGHRVLSSYEAKELQQTIELHEQKIQSVLETPDLHYRKLEMEQRLKNKASSADGEASSKTSAAAIQNDEKLNERNKLSKNHNMPEEAFNRKEKQMKALAEEQKARRIERLEAEISRNRATLEIKDADGRRRLIGDKAAHTHKVIAHLERKLEWTKNKPAEDLVPPSMRLDFSNQASAQSRTLQSPPLPHWQSMNKEPEPANNGKMKQTDPAKMQALVNKLRPMVEDHKAGIELMSDYDFEKAIKILVEYDSEFQK